MRAVMRSRKGCVGSFQVFITVKSPPLVPKKVTQPLSIIGFFEITTILVLKFEIFSGVTQSGTGLYCLFSCHLF